MMQQLINTTGFGFNPNVTPEQAAKFMEKYLRCYPDVVLARFSEYPQIIEAIQILLSRDTYCFAEGNGKIYIHHTNTCTLVRCNTLDWDWCIFIMDICLKNEYAHSIKNNIFVNYIESHESPILNGHVEKFKQLCLNSTKTC